MRKSYNGMLILGISIIIVGLFLLTYCVTSYSEIKTVTDKIDFDELDNNIRMSTSDKYYEYISIWDILNQKLEKNKNLPVKNMSCAYLDYAQHDVKSLYKLIYKNANEDTEKRSVVENNIQTLLKMYDNYKTCKKTPTYQEELRGMLDEIDSGGDIYYQGRMETFVNGNKDIERTDDAPQYSDQGIQPAQNSPAVYQTSYPQGAQQPINNAPAVDNQTYHEVQQYLPQDSQTSNNAPRLR